MISWNRIVILQNKRKTCLTSQKKKAKKHTMDVQLANGRLQNAQNCMPNYFTGTLWLSCNPLFWGQQTQGKAFHR